MQRIRDLSIKRKLTLIIMLTSGIALLLASAALVTYDWIASKEALTRRIDTLAQIVGFNSTAALAFDNAADAAETLSALRVEPHIVAACIYARDGRPFATYHRDGLEFPLPPAEAAGQRFAEDQLFLFHSIELSGEQVGTVYIRADLREMRERLHRYAGIVLLAVGLASLAAFLIGSRLREVIATPVVELAQKMRLVSQEQNYAVRATKRGEDELGQLIDGFNAMLTQIQDRDAALQQARDELEKRARELQDELVERQRIEVRIKESLQEKEVLLKEIHHRVKNNLQVISSLLDLQSGHIEDPHAQEMFRDSQNRVNSMGLIHEQLYQADDLARIDFEGYIGDLIGHIFFSYGVDPQRVRVEVSAAEVIFDVAMGIPCGLIINELVSNSLKYAFPGDRQGAIRIHVHADTGANEIVLSIGDDGIGFPEHVDFRNTPSLGLKLVNTLVRQLRGEIALNREAGTEFRIAFPA